jgi:hypothetical protein
MQHFDVSYEFVDKYLEMESLENKVPKSSLYSTEIGPSSSYSENQPHVVETGQTVCASNIQDAIEEEINTFSTIAMDDGSSIRSTTRSEEPASYVISKLGNKEKEINNSSHALDQTGTCEQEKEKIITE